MKSPGLIETMVITNQVTVCHDPEDNNRNYHRHENIKSHIINFAIGISGTCLER
jgi:hypothetical protein